MGEMIDLDKDTGNEFQAYLAKPISEVKGGIILIHEVWGLVDHTKNVADRFAEQGYLVLAPDLISGNGINLGKVAELQEGLFDPKRKNEVQPKLRELLSPMQAPEFGENTTKKALDCFNYLAEQTELNGKIAAVGFCFGGSYSFSLAVAEPNLKAAVPFYGHANFTVQDLEAIRCPILAFYGEKDEGLMESLPELKKKMEEAGVNFTAQVYPNCGHAFFNNTNRFAYNEAAAKDAWDKTLSFLRQSMEA